MLEKINVQMVNQLKEITESIPQKVNALCNSLSGTESIDLIDDLIAAEIHKPAIWSKETVYLYDTLLNYFQGVSKDCDMSKGIALTGDYGVGKTTAFNVFQKYLNKIYPFVGNNSFRIISVEDVISAYNADSFIDSVNLYNVREDINGVKKRCPVNVVLNEFGHDYRGKNYGTDYNEIIEMFMMKRYDIFQQHKKLTHITTNYYPSEMQKIFDARLIDRFVEMFNFIDIKGMSLRK